MSDVEQVVALVNRIHALEAQLEEEKKLATRLRDTIAEQQVQLDAVIEPGAYQWRDRLHTVDVEVTRDKWLGNKSRSVVLAQGLMDALVRIDFKDVLIECYPNISDLHRGVVMRYRMGLLGVGKK